VVFCWCYNASLTYTAAAADPAGTDRSLTYTVDEGRPKGYFVGNIVNDLGIYSNLPDSDFNKLSFVILNSSQANSQLFSIDEKSGKLTTASLIDREVICLRQPTCFVTLDVAVQPQLFFRIIKVLENKSIKD